MINYQFTKEFTVEELERLFLSVHWESGKFPAKLQTAMRNSSIVISAWDEERLVGLVRGLDDGACVGFVHFLLVDPAYQGMHIGYHLMDMLMQRYDHLLHIKIMPSDPATIPFYEKFGFRQYSYYSALEKNRF